MVKNARFTLIDVQLLPVSSFCLILLSPKIWTGQCVVKAVQIHSPKCSFFRVARWFDITNFIIEKKITKICAVHRNELYTGLLNSSYLLSATCRQKLNVEWH